MCGRSSTVRPCPVCASRMESMRLVHVLSPRSSVESPAGFCGVPLVGGFELGAGGSPTVGDGSPGVGSSSAYVSVDNAGGLVDAVVAMPCGACLVNFGRWSVRRGGRVVSARVTPTPRRVSSFDVVEEGDEVEFQSSRALVEDDVE